MIKPRTFNGHKGPVYTLCTSSIADGFLSGSGDGLVVRWSLVDLVGDVIVDVGLAIFSIFEHSSSGHLFIGTEGGGLHIVDLRTKKEIQFFQVHSKGIFRIIAFGDHRIICAGGDGTISIWELGDTHEMAKWVLYRQIPIIEAKLRDLALTNDQNQLAIACGDGGVRIFETITFNEVNTIEAHPGARSDGSAQGTTSVVFHPTKPVLLSGGKDGHIRSWRTNTENAPLMAVPAHRGGVYRIAFNEIGTLFATASRDKTAKVWDANTFDPVQRMDRSAGGHTHSVNSVLWLANGSLTASDDRTIKYWPVHALDQGKTGQ